MSFDNKTGQEVLQEMFEDVIDSERDFYLATKNKLFSSEGLSLHLNLRCVAGDLDFSLLRSSLGIFFNNFALFIGSHNFTYHDLKIRKCVPKILLYNDEKFIISLSNSKMSYQFAINSPQQELYEFSLFNELSLNQWWNLLIDPYIKINLKCISQGKLRDAHEVFSKLDSVSYCKSLVNQLVAEEGRKHYYDPKVYGGIKKIELPSELFKHPDFLLAHITSKYEIKNIVALEFITVNYFNYCYSEGSLIAFAKKLGDYERSFFKFLIAGIDGGGYDVEWTSPIKLLDKEFTLYNYFINRYHMGIRFPVKKSWVLYFRKCLGLLIGKSLIVLKRKMYEKNN